MGRLRMPVRVIDPESRVSFQMHRRAGLSEAAAFAATSNSQYPELLSPTPAERGFEIPKAFLAERAARRKQIRPPPICPGAKPPKASSVKSPRLMRVERRRP